MTHFESPGVRDALPGDLALPLLRYLPTLGLTTTVVLHGGCVFEFKGLFPAGDLAGGYYNLDGPVPGFHGHLRIDAIDRVRFQDRPHRDRPSYAFAFEDAAGRSLFKVFLGRNDAGDVIPAQLAAFNHLRQGGALPIRKETPA